MSIHFEFCNLIAKFLFYICNMLNKAVNNIISLSSICIIIIGSMVQFHHHSHNGDVHIIYSSIIETLIECQHTAAYSPHCNQSNDSNAGRDNCPLKLSTFNHITKHTNIPVTVRLMPYCYNLHSPILYIYINEATGLDYTTSFYRNILTHLFKASAIGLRSPPCH